MRNSLDNNFKLLRMITFTLKSKLKTLKMKANNELNKLGS